MSEDAPTNELEAFFQREKSNPHRLALAIGVARSNISRALSGEQMPSRELALKVERGTKGAVSAERFIALSVAAWREREGIEPTPPPEEAEPAEEAAA